MSWRGKSIGDVLKMEIDEAVDFFASMPNISHPLKLLKDVGLGYLTLGQPSPTLSGGEAQRIKLVTELSKVRDDVTRRSNKAPHTLYVLDEPTVGLHMADVERLIRVLHRLVDGELRLPPLLLGADVRQRVLLCVEAMHPDQDVVEAADRWPAGSAQRGPRRARCSLPGRGLCSGRRWSLKAGRCTCSLRICASSRAVAR